MYLEKTIAVHFPGGREGFAKAGCDSVLIPVPAGKDIAYMLLPPETTGSLDLGAFKKAIEHNSKAKGVEVRWISDSNFKGCDPAMVKERLRKVSKQLPEFGLNALIMVRPAVVVVVAVTSDEFAAKLMVEVFGKAQGIRHIVVVTPKGVEEHEYPEPKEPEYMPEITQVVEAKRDDGKKISAGDIADIASLLEHCKDVTDFLDKI
jgi:hypothetical protein